MTSQVLQDAIKAHEDFFVANKEQFQLSSLPAKQGERSLISGWI